MTESQLLDLSDTAGWLSEEEYAAGEAVAWRLVLAELRGAFGADEDDDGADTATAAWHAARQELTSAGQVDAVLEVLAGHIARGMLGCADTYPTPETWPQVMANRATATAEVRNRIAAARRR